MPKLKKIWLGLNKIEHLSSKLIIPIQEQIEFISFVDNGILNDFHIPTIAGSVSLNSLMTIIDEKCKNPNEMVSLLVSPQDKAFMKSLIHGFEKLYSSGFLSDLKILVDVDDSNNFKTMLVHKMVLATHSSVFAEIFRKDESRTEMIITGFSEPALNDFFGFLYTGKYSTHSVTLKEVFRLAINYNVSQLQKYCEEFVLADIEHSNAFQILALGKMASSQSMMQRAIAEIIKVQPEFKISDEFVDKPDVVNKIVDAMLLLDTGIKELEREYDETKKKIFANKFLDQHCGNDLGEGKFEEKTISQFLDQLLGNENLDVIEANVDLGAVENAAENQKMLPVRVANEEDPRVENLPNFECCCGKKILPEIKQLTVDELRSDEDSEEDSLSFELIMEEN